MQASTHTGALSMTVKQTSHHLKQAAAFLQKGEWPQAEVILTELSKVLPKYDAIWLLLGTTRAQLGIAQGAEVALKKATELNPGSAEAYNNLGFVIDMQHRPDEAKRCYARAIQIDPLHSNAQYNLALLLQNQQQPDQAQTHYRLAIDANPLYTNALNNLGLLLLEKGQTEEAFTFLERALRFAPNDANIITNAGHALYCLHRFTEAINLHDRALIHAPTLAQAHSNKGLALQAIGDTDLAAAEFRAALSAQPDFAIAKHNLAHLELATEKYTLAWSHYASRPSKRAQRTQEVPNLAKDLSGQTVLIRGEQGLGDELFFLRFVPELLKRGARPLIDCAKPLQSLIQRIPGPSIANPEQAPDSTTLTLLVGDLPYALGYQDGHTLPPPLALTPLPERVNALRAALAAAGPPPYVGLTWRAGTPGFNQLNKSIPLATLQPLLTTTCTWVNLQRNPLPHELAELGRYTGQHVADLSHTNADLEDMLALLSLLDDYIGVSNTNMHLRAALSLPAQVLVPYPPEWRWRLTGAHSPWFPTFNVLRQSLHGDWNPAITACSKTLAQRLHRPAP